MDVAAAAELVVCRFTLSQTGAPGGAPNRPPRSPSKLGHPVDIEKTTMTGRKRRNTSLHVG